ncbi:MAG: hypothetical protein RAO94_12680 [Candidatus Stygibacter australis]|nr:hypothetical protein [Candidatus Stygibacter australis]
MVIGITHMCHAVQACLAYFLPFCCPLIAKIVIEGRSRQGLFRILEVALETIPHIFVVSSGVQLPDGYSGNV